MQIYTFEMLTKIIQKRISIYLNFRPIKCTAIKYISTLHSIITLGSSYIFRNNCNTYLQFHIVYCRDVIQHKVQVTTDREHSTSQLHMMLLV